MSSEASGQPPSNMESSLERPLPPLLNLLAALALILPAWGLPLYFSLSNKAGDISKAGERELLFTALLTFTVLCGFILLLQLFVVGKPLRELQPVSAPLKVEIFEAVKLAAMLFAGVITIQIMLYVSRLTEPPEVLQGIDKALAANPRLLAVFLGPVVWLQAAVTEELTRAFLITRLSQVWSAPGARLMMLLVLALCFGLGHIYQGWAGVLGTSYIGFILGAYYMQTRRLLPVILAHGIYDTVTVVLLVSVAGRGLPAVL